MRIYLDNCCFNRPFDDQGQVKIRLEAEAKLFIQESIRAGDIELAWSYILDYENSANPFPERRNTISSWKEHSTIDVEESPDLLVLAKSLLKKRLSAYDALHVACGITADCDNFLTTDDNILKQAKYINDIVIIDPLSFIREINL